MGQRLPRATEHRCERACRAADRGGVAHRVVVVTPTRRVGAGRRRGLVARSSRPVHVRGRGGVRGRAHSGVGHSGGTHRLRRSGRAGTGVASRRPGPVAAPTCLPATRIRASRRIPDPVRRCAVARRPRRARRGVDPHRRPDGGARRGDDRGARTAHARHRFRPSGGSRTDPTAVASSVRRRHRRLCRSARRSRRGGTALGDAAAAFR